MLELLAADKARPVRPVVQVGSWFVVERLDSDLFEIRMKRRGLADQLFFVTSPAQAAAAWQFAAAWERCWAQMVTERAWPHATTERRSWRAAMVAVRPEYLACWLGVETGFSRYVAALAAAMAGATDGSRFAGEPSGARLVA